MIIIAFSNKTSKIIPRLLCYELKHVAPIVPYKSKLVMYQFIRPGHIEKVILTMRDIKILQAHGWKFVYVNGTDIPHDFAPKHARTCVDLTKHAIGLHDWRIQTPRGLYKKIKYAV